MPRTIPLYALASVLAATLALAAQQPLYDSFESGVPASWRPSRPGALSVSDRHAKAGRFSLQWDWRAGDSIAVRQTLGDIFRQGGYGGSYAKATFGVWLYLEQPAPGEITFEFREAAKPPASFRFPLNFTGWRRAHLRYTWQSQFQGKVSPRTDHIRLLAPKTGQGRVFIDLVVYNGLMDYREQYLPTSAEWKPPQPGPALFPLPDTITPQERDALRSIPAAFEPEPAGETDPAGFDKLRQQVEALAITRAEHGTRGYPVVHSARLDFYAGVPGVHPPDAVTGAMLDIATRWRRDTDPARRQQMEAWYILLADHLHDQGMAPGSGFAWNGYAGRPLAQATFLMRDVLARHNRLARAADYFDYCYGFSNIFDDTTIAPDMDHFRIGARFQLYGALMQPSEPLQVRALRAFTRRLSKDIVCQSRNGFKPDGSAFHHGMAYFGYAEGGLAVTASVAQALSPTPFRLTPDALARLKQAALAMRFYCNRLDLPLSLCGRHPFTNQRFRPQTLALLAQCGSPDGSQPLDPELAAAYLRLAPDQST
ncbi:MAG TPA: chondroitinase family polysaccharide lyase, partial [Candidatus Brocadiia bacterium]|nr:chondroitinase family polysaccharide lyase [Candidatus Brocadiia bacterium]